jgi:hypothetical protein
MQNGIPVGLRSSPSFGLSRSGQLTAIIQSLFWDGSQGWWYDDNDTTTLFQDSAGTTPVTAVEQFVGLQLDKSRGLVLGPELVTNSGPSFVNTTGWTGVSTSGAAPTLSINDGWFRVTANGVSGGWGGTVINYPAGWINVAVQWRTSGSASAARVTTFFPGVDNDLNGVSGSQTLYLLKTGGSGEVRIHCKDPTGWVEYRFISVRASSGNHRYAPASGNRPIWSKRVNLLTKTEQFDDAAWTKTNSSITPNATTAPNGTLTADKLVENTATSIHRVEQTITPTTTGTFTASIAAKAGERIWLVIQNTFGSNNTTQLFNLSTGSLGVQTGAGGTATITSLGDGWYRCTLTTVTTTTNAGNGNFYVSNANNANNYTGDGTSGIYIWGADLRPANQATGLLPLYQRVNTSTDYDTNGFPGYLKADGVDDFLQTNSIDFTATDKVTLCAGVRKLSDAARAMVTELGADVPQSFQFNAPSAAATTYSFASRGSAAASSAVYSNSAVAAPITNVATGIGDISGDSAILRINGTQVATSTTDQGTGNYGNLPAYFFHRNTSPATLRFNGYEYGNIAVGKLLTADQLTALETYMNGLTKAY